MSACDLCRGACCEDLVFPAAGLTEQTRAFLEVRGVARVQLTRVHQGIAFPVPCQHLADGRCAIYESRPFVCALYAAGGEACRETVKRRRSPEEAARILAAM